MKPIWKPMGTHKEIAISATFAMTVDTREQRPADGVREITCSFHWAPEQLAAAQNPMFHLEWSVPMKGFHYQWHPAGEMSRQLRVDWLSDLHTMTAISAPVFCLFHESGENRYTAACSEVKKELLWNAGVHEEDGTLQLRLSLPLESLAGSDGYSISLRLDESPCRFDQALPAVAAWWEKVCGIAPMEVPEVGREPVYSTWYAFHQNFTAAAIEEDCRFAAEMGMRAVIVDDGWQTDDNNRGYAFCGDWEVTPGKIPDMAAHVAKIHELGMKYMLWFSVPYMGKNAKGWSRFQDKLLSYNERLGAGVLDPRYPQVRQYLIDTYCKAVSQWGLDGLKLDFIDQFRAVAGTPVFCQGMDYTCVQEAADRLMGDVRDALQKLRPEMLVEFRQPYIGPNMRKYGNLFRVCDCPADVISNRVGMVDLRLLSGSTAVHSDMLMWNAEESCEDAALQLLNVLFCTPQISVHPGKLSQEHRRMLTFWLGFMREHRELLQLAPLRADSPQLLYPRVWAEKDGVSIVGVYGKNLCVPVDGRLRELYLVNASGEEGMVLQAKEAREWKISIYNCLGEVVSTRRQALKGLEEIKAPKSGMIRLEAAE